MHSEESQQPSARPTMAERPLDPEEALLLSIQQRLNSDKEAISKLRKLCDKQDEAITAQEGALSKLQKEYDELLAAAAKQFDIIASHAESAAQKDESVRTANDTMARLQEEVQQFSTALNQTAEELRVVKEEKEQLRRQLEGTSPHMQNSDATTQHKQHVEGADGLEAQADTDQLMPSALVGELVRPQAPSVPASTLR